jgi:alpha-beta hydrolase superfamily lysophospholipase
MIDSIETRELLLLDGLGVIVPATYHKARRRDSRSQTHPDKSGRIGVIFLNSLSPTRAATGDSAVYWADSIAQIGYPSFRLDLPGFGDSYTDPPERLLEYINRGSYASVASAKAREIVERFSLSGVIFVGLCAGAVTAIYSAASTQECKGLLLLDPYFHLPLKSRSKLWQKLTGRISRTDLGIEFEKLYDRLTEALRRLAGDAPPSNANFPLLSCWRDVATTGLPTILFRAPGIRHRGEFDYLKHVLKLAGRKGDVVVKTIEEANHTFSNRAGRDAVRQQVESWLTSHFARDGERGEVNRVSPSSANDSQIYQLKSKSDSVDTRTVPATRSAMEGG